MANAPIVPIWLNTAEMDIKLQVIHKFILRFVLKLSQECVQPQLKFNMQLILKQ